MVIRPWPWIFKVKFWKCCISGMGGPIDMERKECELTGLYTHFVTFNFYFNHDPDLGFSRPNLETVISQESDGRLKWNERDVGQQNVRRLTFWLQALTSPINLILAFEGKILKLLSLRNGRIDSLGMKWMWVVYDVGCTMRLTLSHGMANRSAK